MSLLDKANNKLQWLTGEAKKLAGRATGNGRRKVSATKARPTSKTPARRSKTPSSSRAPQNPAEPSARTTGLQESR